jgi:pseudouridine kinase
MKRYSISVIGASVLDVTGQPNAKLILGDSNPGKVFITPGGVARNIAENLSLLDLNVNLICAMGNDAWGNILSELCKKSNIDTSLSVFRNDESSALYLSINNFNKHLELAVVNTDITNHITPEYIESIASEIEKSDLIIVETNLTKQTLEYIADKFSHKPIFLDLVSVTKSNKVKENIGKFHTIKPNLLEAEFLTDIEMTTKSDLFKMSDYFLEKGVKQVFITMGVDGCYYASKDNRGFIEGIKMEIKNSSGAGDSYISGLAYSFLAKKSIEESAHFATAMSLATVLDKNSVNPNVTVEMINDLMQKYNLI